MELEGPIKEAAVQTFRVEPETTVNVQSAKAMKQMEETYERTLAGRLELIRLLSLRRIRKLSSRFVRSTILPT